MLIFTVAIRFDCQSPPGNAEPWLAYRLTVTGCPWPVPEIACSIPKSTDVTSYSRPPVNVFMLKARKYELSVCRPPALHDTELPDTISWLVDSVITGGQFPPGDPVGVAVAVGVGVGDPPPGPQCDFSTVLV